MFNDEDIVAKVGWNTYFVYYNIPGIPGSCVLLNICTDEYNISPMDNLRLIKGQEFLNYISAANIKVGSIVTRIGKSLPGEVIAESGDHTMSAVVTRYDGVSELVHKKLLRQVSEEQLSELYENKQIIAN